MDIIPVNPNGPSPIVSTPAANTRKEINGNGVGFKVNAVAGGIFADGKVAGVHAKALNVRREVGAAGLNYRVGAAAAGIKKK